MNEATLLPVFVRAAPAQSLVTRFPDAASTVLTALEVPSGLLDAELAEMATARMAPTADRSIVGVMNEFAFLADHLRSDLAADLSALSLRLAATPLGPLRARHGSPDRELTALLTTSHPRGGDFPCSAEPTEPATHPESPAQRSPAAMPDLDVQRIRRWATAKTPARFRQEMRLETDFDPLSVTILDCRSPWQPETDQSWTRQPIARLRWHTRHRTWAVYWPDRHGNWHRYDRVQPTSDVSTFLAEIDSDPTAIFWG